jgi:hypothetical protein
VCAAAIFGFAALCVPVALPVVAGLKRVKGYFMRITPKK